MDNAVDNAFWRNFALGDYWSWLSNNAWDRGWEGRRKHGETFQGNPIDHAIEEGLDLVYYLYAAKRQQDGEAPTDDSNACLNGLARSLHTQAKNNGWHDKERTFGDEVALIHSEVSEALEEYRDTGNPTDPKVVEELADIIIRVLDVVGKYDIDIEGAIRAKIVKNADRPYRHGNKAL